LESTLRLLCFAWCGELRQGAGSSAAGGAKPGDNTSSVAIDSYSIIFESFGYGKDV